MATPNPTKKNKSISYLDGVFEAWRSCDSAYLQLVRQWGLSLNTVWALEYLVQCPDGVEPAVLADKTHMLRQTVTVVLNDDVSADGAKQFCENLYVRPFSKPHCTITAMLLTVLPSMASMTSPSRNPSL